MTHSSARSRQRGLSLIELLVALVLGLIIVAALSQLFVNISRTNLEMAKTNSQIENARFAMQFLQNDIVHAGYWGGFVPEFDDFKWEGTPGDAPTLKPPPCLDFSTPWSAAHIDALLGIPVEVFAADAQPASCVASGVIADRLSGTDVLVVRHAGTCEVGDANCEAATSGNLYMQVSNCDTEIEASNKYSLDPNSYGLTQLDCLTVESRRRFVQNIYYVRDWANVDGDDIPTLVRSEFDLVGGTLEQQPAVALVEGIERFRVEMGIERESQSGEAIDNTAAIDWLDDDTRTTPRNRGDGAPEDNFERCLSEAGACTPALLSNVVAVKVYLLARANAATAGYTDTKTYTLGSVAALGPFNDSFKRHVFSSSMRLNNVVGRRETPFDPNEVVP